VSKNEAVQESGYEHSKWCWQVYRQWLGKYAPPSVMLKSLYFGTFQPKPVKRIWGSDRYNHGAWVVHRARSEGYVLPHPAQPTLRTLREARARFFARWRESDGKG